ARRTASRSNSFVKGTRFVIKVSFQLKKTSPLFRSKSSAPRVMITDKLGSYAAAKRETGLMVCGHRQHKGLNNRAENSHQPIRRRERFKSARHVQRFTSIHDPIYNLHYFPRNHFSSVDYRELRQAAASIWREIAGLKAA
ncbi:DDE-type integrase/transposase/recombinase, partial [Brucellaceae bacterium D45D]